jgi:ABC-type branched-subunit amino acid transport system substrate-binding protein
MHASRDYGGWLMARIDQCRSDLGSRIGDPEIRIGMIMPYTGPLAAFGAIEKAEATYFDMVNEKGGINGRKVRFISYNDNKRRNAK